MSETDKELSLQIYQFVCNIIGSEEVVKTRRKMLCALYSVIKIKYARVISSGSKAEGLDLKGSDIDEMWVYDKFQVHENKCKVSSVSKKYPIIMDISDTKPGFTKLKLNNLNTYKVIQKWVAIVEGEAYISSKLFRELEVPKNMIIHGPCQSIPNDFYDMARCFQCKEWITPAQQWIFRSRSSWPDHKLVMSVIKKGVLFVPIGCKGSLNEDLEWRISFSMAEKQLIFSFTHTQLLCYALLKIILKDIIKKKHSEIICSYFLKTIMFWLCEESSPLEWHPGNMICCFKNCLKRLIYCVEYKTCLHYFIPGNNLFEGRFTDYQHTYLLNTLKDIYHSLLNYIFHTETFQRFIEEQGMSSLPYLTASSLVCLSFTKFVIPYIKSSNRKQIITSIFNMNDLDLSLYIISLFFLKWMQSPDGINCKGRNKYQYTQNQISLQCFKTGLNTGAVSAWSLLASLFYKHKRFNECIDIVNYTLSKCTPDKILLSAHISLSEQTYFQNVSEVGGMLLAWKHLLIEDVWFERPYYLLPVELNPLTINDVDRFTIVPPVVYLNMLLFLCLHHLGDYRGKLNALRDLELTIREGYFIHWTNFNIAIKCLLIAKSLM